MTCDEDNGQRRAVLDQAILQFHARHSPHSHVHNQTRNFTGIVSIQKSFCRIKAPDTIVFAFKQPLKGVADRFIVINYVDRAFFWDQTHSRLH